MSRIFTTSFKALRFFWICAHPCIFWPHIFCGQFGPFYIILGFCILFWAILCRFGLFWAFMCHRPLVRALACVCQWLCALVKNSTAPRFGKWPKMARNGPKWRYRLQMSTAVFPNKFLQAWRNFFCDFPEVVQNSAKHRKLSQSFILTLLFIAFCAKITKPRRLWNFCLLVIAFVMNWFAADIFFCESAWSFSQWFGVSAKRKWFWCVVLVGGQVDADPSGP